MRNTDIITNTSIPTYLSTHLPSTYLTQFNPTQPQMQARTSMLPSSAVESISLMIMNKFTPSVDYKYWLITL